jgi:hypothetical protein
VARADRYLAFAMPNCNYVISVNVPEGTRKKRRIAAAAYATQHAADVVALQACCVNAIQQAVAPIQPVTAIPVLNAATSIAFPLMGSAIQIPIVVWFGTTMKQLKML